LWKEEELKHRGGGFRENPEERMHGENSSLEVPGEFIESSPPRRKTAYVKEERVRNG